MRLEETYQKYKDLHTDEYYNTLNYNTLKICSTCNNSKELYHFSKHRREIDGFTYICKDCNKQISKKRGINLTYVKSRAKRLGLEFDLKQEDLFLPKFCPILNIELNYSNKSPKSNSPSIDRIDNSKGYIKGNVIIMSRLANAMKSCATFEQLKTFSENILKLINTYEIQGTLGDITDIFPNLEKISLDL